MGVKKKILLAENERIIALDIKNILEACGYTVLDIVFNSSLIFSYLSQQKPDLLITGTKGNPNYTTLIKRVVDEFQVPALIITGIPENELSGVIGLKGCTFLRKPIDPEQLIKAVAEVLAVNSQ